MQLNARIAGLKDALGTDVIVSFKASNHLDLLLRLGPENYDGIEVASKGELHLIAGKIGPNVFINTPALDEPLVRAGIGTEATFIVDTPDHLDLIARVKRKRSVAPLSLRLSNKLIAEICPDAPTLRDDQFGMDMGQLRDGLVPLTFRSLNSFMQPFVRRPRGFCHPAMSDGGVDYKNH